MARIFRSKIRSSEITPESVFRQRRVILQAAGLGLGAAGTGIMMPERVNAAGADLSDIVKWSGSTDEVQSSFEQATSYNNFYELGTDKGDPEKNADKLVTEPWTVEVGGECEKGGKYALEDILKPHTLEERVYRLRCVEAWSMVIPWVCLLYTSPSPRDRG